MRSILLSNGEKFNSLIIIKLDHIKKYTNNNSNKKFNIEFYKCLCVCGNIIICRKGNLKSGHTGSCGCKSKRRRRVTKQYKGNKKLYYVWNSMKQRCYNKNNKSYVNYGNRNIIICDIWKNKFESFSNWAMDNGYKEGLTLDRIDNDGNYEPNNCRWATWIEQNRNTRRNKNITYRDKTKCLLEWSNILDINYHILYNRLKSGMNIVEAFEIK